MLHFRADSKNHHALFIANATSIQGQAEFLATRGLPPNAAQQLPKMFLREFSVCGSFNGAPAGRSPLATSGLDVNTGNVNQAKERLWRNKPSGNANDTPCQTAETTKTRESRTIVAKRR